MNVGDRLVISAEPFDSQVTRVTARYVTVTWPWREQDPESENVWRGAFSFRADPDHPDWNNTPWRIEPDVAELEAGMNCMVGIPPTEVRIAAVWKYEPPADYGFLPRPDYGIAVVPVDQADDPEAGYEIYPNGAEPIQIDVVG
ncbi:hypothetical protein ACTI_66500 [Actinoplanes sp. OR16]|uniref:hypothetical protein n=1 Tax=Actinoplanes sp. OR16 TaxID=946334 RepID=UPI000F6EE3CE|nr:hypothetical protein [Actinoplanes sp. OR16]BBH69965.1 hypothetical protein ACTI_66500 [Actinoplanes sp. OR16]